MKSGVCPKCQSSEVYREEGSRFVNEKVLITDEVWLPKATSPDKYICAGCGYLEYYVASEEHIQQIREHWDRVSPT